MSERTVKVDDIVGLSEVCQIIGFTDGYVSLLILRPETMFPQPIKTLSALRLWDAEQVRAWKVQWDKVQWDKAEARLEVLRARNTASATPKPEPKTPVSAEDRAARFDALLGRS